MSQPTKKFKFITEAKLENVVIGNNSHITPQKRSSNTISSDFDVHIQHELKNVIVGDNSSIQSNSLSLLEWIKLIYKNSHQVQNKMRRYSCCTGLIGSEGYKIEQGTHKVIMEVLTELKQDTLKDYLQGFENMDWVDHIICYGPHQLKGKEGDVVGVGHDLNLEQYKILNRMDTTYTLISHTENTHACYYNWENEHPALPEVIISFPEGVDCDVSEHTAIQEKLNQYNQMLVYLLHFIYKE